jgi:uncharacterized membrane protein YvbJ
MVYCRKCGTENVDEAVNCSKCGASLNVTTSHGYRRYEGDFFRRGNIWGIVVGIFMIMWGGSSLLGVNIWDKVWPMFIILVGLIIITNSFMRRRW